MEQRRKEEEIEERDEGREKMKDWVVFFSVAFVPMELL